MRKLTEADGLFEKFGIEVEGQSTLHNQTFFLHGEDAQAEGTTNSVVMSRAKNTGDYLRLVALDNFQPFLKAAKEFDIVSRNKPQDTFFVRAEALESALLTLFSDFGMSRTLYLKPGFLAVYGTPHKGLDKLRIEIPSDVEDPAAFMDKVQALYMESRKSAAYLNVTLTSASVRGVDTLYKAMWLLNRLVEYVTRDLEQFVPGQVNVFATQFTQLASENVQDRVAVTVRLLAKTYRLYANDESMCQWLYRVIKLQGRSPDPVPVTELLTGQVDSHRRMISRILDRVFTGDDFIDYVATHVQNHGDFHPSHDRFLGAYRTVHKLWAEKAPQEDYLKWVEKTLGNVESNEVQKALALHSSIYEGGQETFLENLGALVNR